MMAAAAFLLAAGGLLALALSMRRHRRDLFAKAPARRLVRVLSVAGWLLILASLVVCIATVGISVGPVLWFGLLTLAGVAVVLLLTVLATARGRRAPPSTIV